MKVLVHSLLSILGPLVVVAGSLGCSSEDPIPPALPMTEAAAVRGQVLVDGLAACRFCHGSEGGVALGGGRTMGDRYGELRAPNISLSSNGIGSWNERDLMRIFRSYQRPDEVRISAAFHQGFEWLSDADLAGIISYLRTLPPSDNQVERREVSFFSRNTTGFSEGAPEVKGLVPRIAPQFTVEYGAYLADNVARCSACHTNPGGFLDSEQYLAGGEEISFDGETKVAPNITSSTSSGIGAWSEGELLEYLRTGKKPDGREVNKRFCPVDSFGRAPASELQALVAYLRTVPAIE
jgi:mono/diheme cytochrome c family protein